MHTYIHTYIHAVALKTKKENMTRGFSYVHTSYIHTYTHTYTHTYRDSLNHGEKDEMGLVMNAVEIVTLRYLQPGQYAIYVNAYPPEESAPTFDSPAYIDVWLGDGIEVCVCGCVGVLTHECLYVYIYTYIHTYIWIYIHTYIHTYIYL